MSTRFFPLRIAIFLSIMSFGLLPGRSEGQFVRYPVAVTGGPAPGRPGEAFDRFNGLALNNAGNVAVVAQTGFNQGGIWITRHGRLSLLTDSSFNETIFLRDDAKLVRANAAEIVVYDGLTPTTVVAVGQPAPGLLDATFQQLDQVVFHANGNMAFTAQIRTEPYAETLYGLWAYRNGALGLIALSGEPAPNLWPDYTYATRGYPVFEYPNHVMSDGGQIAFTAKLEPTEGYYPPLEVGLFTNRGGAVSLLYREGDPVPGLTNGETFKAFKHVRFVEGERLAFSAVLDGPSVDASNWLGVFRETATGLQMIARMGDQAANQPVDHLYTGLRNVTLAETTVSFLGISNVSRHDPQTGVQRVWAGPPDELLDIISADWLQEPPGAEGDTAILIRVTGNRDGRLVVHTADVAGDEYRETLWMVGDVEPQRVIGVGDRLHGRTVDTIIRYVLNDRGELAVHLGFDNETEGVFLIAPAGDFNRRR